ncbi:MAG TPA: AI-2E family transporter [Vicinamibacterales bacterium]|jgi:predicted PurR-regulated permease PerM|nr:AI-2E family transporter [Vicinamibacterales bacterium]
MPDSEFNRRLLRTVITVSGAVIVLATLWAARDALIFIYVSALMAMGFSPLVRLIERSGKTGRGRRVPRVLAILSIYLAVLGAFALIAMLVIPALIDQATALWQGMPEHFTSAQRTLIHYKLLSHPITWQEAVQQTPMSAGQNAVTTVVSAVFRVIGGVIGAITIVILSFYLLIEGETLLHSVSRFFPAHRRSTISAAAAESVTKVSAWLRGQLTLAGVMGTFAAVGLGILHVPFFYVIALVAAVGETIPVLGPIIGGVTAVAVALTVSNRLAVVVGVYFVILHQLESNILVPKIMERRVGVSPVTVMVALLIGVSLYGIIGAILAIPTAAILSVAVDQFVPGHTS